MPRTTFLILRSGPKDRVSKDASSIRLIGRFASFDETPRAPSPK
jgi:hypothetical protein